MKILLIGGGGRESALAYKLSRSPLISELMIYGGNPAMAAYGSLVSPDQIDATGQLATEPLYATSSLTKVAQWCHDQPIDLVISGPEAPICADLKGELARHQIPCFAPNLVLSQLESSKQYAKELMLRSHIPTAACDYATSPAAAHQLANRLLKASGGVVLKADGLAGGKGVFVCKSGAEVESALHQLQATMGKAASTLLCEQLLVGHECSYFAMIGGSAVIPMGFVRDYKRLLDQDQGPNTGGMGAHTALTHLPHDAEAQVHAKILEPLLHSLRQQDLQYTGFLYIGLMWTEEGPHVLEYNIRLGDPECQILALADSSDWLEAIAQVNVHATKTAAPQATMQLLREPAPLAPTLGVVCASANYPWLQKPVSPHPLPDTLWQQAELPHQCQVFGAAITRTEAHFPAAGPGAGRNRTREPSQYAASQGRVLTVVATAADLHTCRQRCYDQIHQLKTHWPDMQYRTDIGLHP